MSRVVALVLSVGLVSLAASCVSGGGGGGDGTSSTGGTDTAQTGASDASGSDRPTAGQCTTPCVGRTCGLDPACQVDCGACSGGTVCSLGGTCVTPDDGDPSPRILTFATNVARLTEGETLRFTAIVSDPDGAGDILGGTLLDPGGATYGSFLASGQPGSYSLDLAWAELHQVAAIQFDAEASRVFVARFFDAAGNTAETTASVTLHCDGDAACGGSCADLSTSADHCGTCGNTCDGTASDTCEEGACVGRQRAVVAQGPNESCEGICSSRAADLRCSTECEVELLYGALPVQPGIVDQFPRAASLIVMTTDECREGDPCEPELVLIGRTCDLLIPSEQESNRRVYTFAAGVCCCAR